jgi:VWFA-related protein
MKKIFNLIPAVLIICQMSASATASSFLGQTQDEKSQVSLQHEVSVALKLVQVQVVDKQGKPVADLGKSDFMLTDNGQPRDITDFEKHISSVATAPPEPQPPASSGVSSRLNRKFFLFFDFSFNYPSGVIKSKKAALDFIDTRVNPEDEIGVISYSAHMGLRLHEFLTRDHAKVRQVVDGLGGGQVMGRAIDLADRYLEELKALAEALGSSTEWIEKTKAIEQSIYADCVADFAARIRDLASTLRYVPGPKNIILFSSGITNFVLYGKRIGDAYSYYEKYGSAPLRERFSDMCKALAASNSVLYAVNVAGQASGRFDDRNLSGELSLKQMASETGGRYFDNISYYQTINEEIQKMTASYYVLGYYIDEKKDGEYHKIEVKVKRKGCRVYGQKGYFDPKPFSEYTANEKSLHLIDLALSDNPYLQEAVNFPLIILPYAIREKAGLALLAKVPVRKIEQTAGQRIEVVTLVFDQKQDVVALKREEVTGWPRSAEDTFISSLVFLDPGEYQCRVVLRNMETGKGARGSCRVAIPGGQNSRFVLLAPLVLRPGKGAVFPEVETETSRDQKQLRFIDIYPFDRERYCPLMEPLDRANTELLAIVRCQGSDLKSPDLAFSSHLVFDSSGEITPVSTSVINRYGNEKTGVYEIRLLTGELRPGEYTLYLFADERNSGLRSTATSAFRVN